MFEGIDGDAFLTPQVGPIVDAMKLQIAKMKLAELQAIEGVSGITESDVHEMLYGGKEQQSAYAELIPVFTSWVSHMLRR